MRYIVIILLFLLANGCGGSSDNDRSIEVYINDDAVQCESSGLTPEQTAQTLINSGIDVLSSTCGYITGLAVAAQCGLGDANINIHRIWPQNLEDAENLGYTAVSELPQGYTEICTTSS